MKTVYTITRYANGWAVDTKTGDLIKDYSAVFEDEHSEEGVMDSVDSLLSLLVNTFAELEDVEFVIPIYEEEVVEESLQKVDDPNPLCGCGEQAKKIMSLNNFRLKGGGWYKDGYSRRKKE